MHDYKEIGTVTALYTYPVKAMAGQDSPDATLSWHGLKGDRRFAFLRVTDSSGLPWVSPREFPRIVAYRARCDDRGDVGSRIVVESPDGDVFNLFSEELLERVSMECGEELRLMQLWRGTYDSMDLSLITSSSIHSVERALGCPLEVERFRPNILIDAKGDRVYPEERWVGKQLRFGDGPDSARVRIDRKTKRCTVIDLDPLSGDPNRLALKAIATNRRNQLGVYGTTQRTEMIRVGDAVFLR